MAEDLGICSSVYVPVLGARVPQRASLHDSILIVDGHFGFGQVVGREATCWAIARARENGVCVLAIRRSGHLDRLHLPAGSVLALPRRWPAPVPAQSAAALRLRRPDLSLSARRVRSGNGMSWQGIQIG